MTAQDLPTLNAALNATAAALLVTGYRFIRAGNRSAHQKAMIGAFAVSVLFLISYLAYHFQAGSVRFTRSGPLRTLYLVILISHSILAAAVPVLAVITLRRAVRGRFELHRAIARWTLPIWLYVSVTGVIVYWMLYRL